ncbi:MAG TPA: hypothetical protein DEB39_00670 [Planctomycetaceae bacterium]|nr:hypothetical protein [Planctomycetaceae bacterium]
MHEKVNRLHIEYGGTALVCDTKRKSVEPFFVFFALIDVADPLRYNPAPGTGVGFSSFRLFVVALDRLRYERGRITVF